MTATKLYNKAISPLEEKIDGEAGNLVVFLASVGDQARHINWHRLITMLIDDETTWNLLTHYGQVSIENMKAHASTYVNSPTRDPQDNDMFYYFLVDSLTNEFHTTVLLYADVYTVANVPVASSLLNQIVILTRVDNPASTMHIREMLMESKRKLLLLKGNITEFNQWLCKQMGHLHAREQEAVDLLYYLWKAYKAAPDDKFMTYIKDLKSQCDCTTVVIPETKQTNIFTTHIIPDESDDDSFQPKDPVELLPPEENNQEKLLQNTNDSMAALLQTTLIDLGPITHVIPEDQEPTMFNPHDKLLWWDY